MPVISIIYLNLDEPEPSYQSKAEYILRILQPVRMNPFSWAVKKKSKKLPAYRLIYLFFLLSWGTKG